MCDSSETHPLSLLSTELQSDSKNNIPGTLASPLWSLYHAVTKKERLKDRQDVQPVFSELHKPEDLHFQHSPGSLQPGMS